MNYLTFLLLFVGLCSCSSTAKISDLVAENTRIEAAPTPNIVVSSNLTLKESRVEKIGSKFVPALLYWGWHNDLEIHLSSSYVEQVFQRSLVERLDSTAETSYSFRIKKFPERFGYVNDGKVIILVIAYTTSMSEMIGPLDGEVVVEYTVRERNGAEATGELRYASVLDPRANYTQSTKRFLGEYFTALESTVGTISDELVAQIKGRRPNQG